MRKKRACLRCDRMFATTPGVRICYPCKRVQEHAVWKLRNDWEQQPDLFKQTDPRITK